MMRTLVAPLTDTVRKPKWTNVDGCIHLSIQSDNKTLGIGWPDRLWQKGFSMNPSAAAELRSKNFKPIEEPAEARLVVLPGVLFAEKERYTGRIRAQAQLMGLLDPHIQFACHLREQFTDDHIKEMGFRMIAVMHRPLHKYNPQILTVYVARGSVPRVDAYAGDAWGEHVGFAFLQP